MIRQFLKFICEISGIPNYWIKSTIFEFRMLIIRIYSSLGWTHYRLNRINSNQNTLNLVFGCGDTAYENWHGVDCFFAKNVDFVLDLRRKLPFKSESVDLCYSEHFIEHLWQNEASLHLREVFRILKPGGRYRIVVPAAIRFIDRYISDDREFFALAFPWAERPMDAVRDILYFAGDHRNVFDVKELKYLGERAGFVKVLESSANGSEIPLLLIDINEPQRVAESLYVEMIKGS